MQLARSTNVVCGLDGSPESAELARIGAELADVLDTGLHLVHVLGAPRRESSVIPAGGVTSRTPRYSTSAETVDSEPGARAMLDGLSDALGVPTATREVVPYGDPARRLAVIARRSRAVMVVVSARGRAPVADALLGSVSSRLAADAPCLVLLVPHGFESRVKPESWRERTFVCGFDGSGPSLAAARHVSIVAVQLGGSVALVSVGAAATRGFEEAASSLQAEVADWQGRDTVSTSLDVSHQIRVGDPAWELERAANALTAPLIAVGSRGLGPQRDVLLGSVARDLLERARRPILVLPATSLLHAERSNGSW